MLLIDGTSKVLDKITGDEKFSQKYVRCRQNRFQKRQEKHSFHSSNKKFENQLASEQLLLVCKA